MAVFEHWSSCVGSNRFTNCRTNLGFKFGLEIALYYDKFFTLKEVLESTQRLHPDDGWWYMPFLRSFQPEIFCRSSLARTR